MVADEVRKLADRAGESLSEIVTLSTRVLDTIHQLSTASAEQSVAVREVAASTQHIAG